MKEFEVKTKVFFGTGSLNYLKEFQNRKIFIVTDPFMVKSGIIDRILQPLSEGSYTIFSDVVPDPPMELVVSGVSQVLEYRPDVMIALGGGSSIDAAKAIMQFAKQIGGYGKMLFVAIPTTSGTGSEVTSFAVITDKGKGVKYPLVSDELLPDIAILEPELVKSVPPAIVADTGLDVLTHAIEAYVSTKATDFSDAFAEKAVKLVFEYLLRSYQNSEDVIAKEKMHNASCLAGIAFNLASLGLNHAIAHNIGGKLHIPHGRTNAILLPYVIDYNANITGYSMREYSEAAKKYAKLANLIGIQGSNPRILVKAFIQEIEKIMHAMKMPRKLTDCKVSQEEVASVVDQIAIGALEDACYETNPRTITKEAIIELIKKVS